MCVCVCVWSLHMSLARRGARPGPLGAYGGRGAASRPWSPRGAPRVRVRTVHATDARRALKTPPHRRRAPRARRTAVTPPCPCPARRGAGGAGAPAPGREPRERESTVTLWNRGTTILNMFF